MVSRLKVSSKLIVIIALLSTFIFTVTGVKAADSSTDAPKFGIKPAQAGTPTTSKGYFTLKGQPGATISDAVIVSNPGTVPVRLVLYPTDALNGEQGGISYKTQDVTSNGVGTWIALDTTMVDLPAKTQQTIPFKITVPNNAGNGDHLGGIAAQLVNDSSSAATANAQSGASMSVKTVTRTITAVQINLGNTPVLSLDITGAKVADNNKLALGLKNNGNTMIQPKGDITLTDTSGKVVLNTPLSLTNILPGNSISYPVSTGELAVGTYKVNASLDFGGAKPAVYEGEVEIKAPVTKAASAPSASQVLPGLDKVVNSQAPAAAPVTAQAIAPIASAAPTAVTPVASTENNSLIAGILIGFGAMLLICGLGLGGFMVLKRGKK